jgi:hypothetical protein
MRAGERCPQPLPTAWAVGIRSPTPQRTRLRSRIARPPGLTAVNTCLQSMAKTSSSVYGLVWSVSSVHLSPATSRRVGVGCGCHRGSFKSTCACWLVIQAFGQPSVHVADVVCECHAPVVIEQPGFNPGDVGGEPSAMPEGNLRVQPGSSTGTVMSDGSHPHGRTWAKASSHQPWPRPSVGFTGRSPPDDQAGLADGIGLMPGAEMLMPRQATFAVRALARSLVRSAR